MARPDPGQEGGAIIHPYATGAYARSLAHWGRAVPGPEWGCNVIARLAAEGCGRVGFEDAAGTYPLAVLAEDADLRGGFARLREQGFVAVVLAVDDVLRPPLDRLVRAFDLVRPFKTHF